MDADLPGPDMALVESAIREKADRIPVNPESGLFDPYPQRMADGLIEVCANTTGTQPTAPTQFTVHADLEALTSDPRNSGVTEIQGGPVIANETARRLSCDALVECTVYDHARILGIGRRSRLIPAWLRRQLWFRDGDADSLGAGPGGSCMRITFNIGLMGDPPTWRIWSFSADITTDSFMSTSGPSKWIRTAGTPTENPMGRSTRRPSQGSIPDSEK